MEPCLSQFKLFFISELYACISQFQDDILQLFLKKSRKLDQKSQLCWKQEPELPDINSEFKVKIATPDV